MLFNLTCGRHFPSKGEEAGIRSFHIRGPCFTKDSINKLSAETGAFDGSRKCISWAGGGYEIPKEGEKNMLTN